MKKLIITGLLAMTTAAWGATAPDAASLSRRISCVVSRIAKSATKTPAADCVNSRRVARWKIIF